MTDSQSGCYICRKHAGDIWVAGGAVYEDDLVYIGHASLPDRNEEGYLGAFLVEPKRHAAGMADLSESEAERVGLLVSRVSRALKNVTDAEHIYVFVLGHHVDHLHVWVIARYPGTPREYWGLNINEWPDAPHGGAAEIAALCLQMKSALRSDDNRVS